MAMSKPARGQRLGDAEADAAPAAGDQGDGRCSGVIAASSVAADVVGDPQRLRGDGQRRVDRRRGRQEAGVDDEEIRMVVGAAERVERRRRRVGARCAPCRIGARACAGRTARDSTIGKPAALQHRLQLRDQRRDAACHVGAPPVEHDALAVDRDPALGIGQVLAHRVAVDGVARRASRAAHSGHAARRLAFRMAPDDLAEQLDIAERRAAVAVVEIEVVDAEGLLVDGVVAERRIERPAPPSSCGS